VPPPAPSTAHAAQVVAASTPPVSQSQKTQQSATVSTSTPQARQTPSEPTVRAPKPVLPASNQSAKDAPTDAPPTTAADQTLTPTPQAPAATDLQWVQPADPKPLAAPALQPLTTTTAVSTSETVRAAANSTFSSSNNPQIVTGISGQLMPSGGTMHLRLAPPELGDLQITVHVRDGFVAAQFETSSDQATRLLSHSLGQLKSDLEAAGVSVERLQVSQTPRNNQQQNTGSNNNSSNKDQQDLPGDESSKRQQQRRELLERMWRKVNGDPLDMVA